MKKRKSSQYQDILKKLLTPKNYVIAAIILLVVVFWLLRNYLIVANVNGQPVSRFELSGRLYNQFGNQILESLINERLITGAARQKGIFITAEELNARQKDITDNGKLFSEATDAAKMEKDAEDILHQQKLNERYQKWFEEIQKDAKITKNL